jgi:orotidine-5'-phosphate decarboxylase
VEGNRSESLKKDPSPAERTILALDTDSVIDASRILESVAGVINWVKVSSRLLFQKTESQLLIELLKDLKYSTIVDLQAIYYEHQLRKLSEASIESGFRYLSVRPGLAETVNLDSLVPSHLDKLMYLTPTLVTQIGVGDPPFLDATSLEDFVRKNIEKFHRQGLSGVITSCRELHVLSQRAKRELILIVPGIREDDIGHVLSHDNQKRKCTVAEAIDAGADYLIIGRPITAAADPRGQALRFHERILRSTKVGK